MRANWGPEMCLPTMNNVERLLCMGNVHKLISKMYCLLLNEGPKPGLYKAVLKLKLKSLQVTMDDC